MAGAVRDLFSTLESFMTDKTSRSRRSPDASDAYTAADIEVLEGLEPVRRRPGMYIGGTDEKAMHHLFAEVIDNSMDEAVAGHASFIEVELEESGHLVVTDNGRGIRDEEIESSRSLGFLGLRERVLAFGGTVEATGQDGKGTCVAVTVPVSAHQPVFHA